jgi:hypothetical protein
VTVTDQHSVRVDRVRDHTRPLMQPAEIARVAREASVEIVAGLSTSNRTLIVSGCRRLVAVGGLAKAAADILEAAQ